MPIEQLTFGVELECYLPEGTSKQACAAAITARGLNCQVESYNHDQRPQWKLTTDGSLNNYATGIEIVSPILTGEQGLADLEKVCEALQDFGCTVNKSTGMHVHVGAARQPLSFFKKLVRLYQTYEPVIDAMMPASRRGSANSYSRSICGTSPTLVASARSREELTSLIARNSGAATVRYHKLNLAAFERHKTVEFRQHSGTLDARKARIWTSLCLRMVETAKGNIEFETAVDTAPRNTARAGSKRATIIDMIMRDGGATRTQIVAATDWPSVSIAQIASSSGLDILTERTGRETRYRLNAVATAPISREITIEGFCATIGANETERAYITARSANLSGNIAWAA
jgi:hypothetical protein